VKYKDISNYSLTFANTCGLQPFRLIKDCILTYYYIVAITSWWIKDYHISVDVYLHTFSGFIAHFVSVTIAYYWIGLLRLTVFMLPNLLRFMLQYHNW